MFGNPLVVWCPRVNGRLTENMGSGGPCRLMGLSLSCCVVAEGLLHLRVSADTKYSRTSDCE